MDAKWIDELYLQQSIFIISHISYLISYISYLISHITHLNMQIISHVINSITTISSYWTIFKDNIFEILLLL